MRLHYGGGTDIWYQISREKKTSVNSPLPPQFDETALVPFCTLSFLFDLNLCPLSLSLSFLKDKMMHISENLLTPTELDIALYN